jgi:hypothetical protein
LVQHPAFARPNLDRLGLQDFVPSGFGKLAKLRQLAGPSLFALAGGARM